MCGVCTTLLIAHVGTMCAQRGVDRACLPVRSLGVNDANEVLRNAGEASGGVQHLEWDRVGRFGGGCPQVGLR